MHIKKKLKVVFCLRDMQMGGVESVLVRMLEQLIQQDDLEIAFVSYVKITEPVYAEWFLQHPQIKTFVLYPCSWLGTRLKRFFLIRFFQHLMRDIYRDMRRLLFRHKILSDADVVVDFYDFGFRKDLRRVNAKRIAWWHSSINKFMSRSYIKYVKNYDLFVTLTDGFVDEFKSRWPKYKNKIVRVYNPLNIDDVNKKIADAIVPDYGKYFVSVARLSADKDIETVLQAFDVFWKKNNHPDVRMVFVGGGNIKKYREMADKLDAHSNIIFVGAQKNPFGFMRGAMAHILSSRSEGLPTVLLEAMAVGTVNISSDCKNGPHEILMKGEAGLLFAPGDSDALAQHMENVWKNKVPVNQMIKVATKSCERFSVENIIPSVVELFKRRGS